MSIVVLKDVKKIRASIKRAAVGASLSCTELGAQAAMPLLVDLNETSDKWSV
jgi:sugar/nucleoside kinase (ribokinase family)